MTAQLDTAFLKTMQTLLPADSLLTDALDDDTRVAPPTTTSSADQHRRPGKGAQSAPRRRPHAGDFVKPVGELKLVYPKFIDYAVPGPRMRRLTARRAGALAAVLLRRLQRAVKADEPSAGRR